MLDWVPIAFITFKVLVFGTAMIAAIKWHYDQGRNGRPIERHAVLRTARKAGAFAVIFTLAVLALVFATFAIAQKIGLDLTLG
jgi:hypothetical protein